MRQLDSKPSETIQLEVNEEVFKERAVRFIKPAAPKLYELRDVPRDMNYYGRDHKAERFQKKQEQYRRRQRR